jgi:hypothetical protein
MVRSVDVATASTVTLLIGIVSAMLSTSTAAAPATGVAVSELSTTIIKTKNVNNFAGFITLSFITHPLK